MLFVKNLVFVAAILLATSPLTSGFTWFPGFKQLFVMLKSSFFQSFYQLLRQQCPVVNIANYFTGRNGAHNLAGIGAIVGVGIQSSSELMLGGSGVLYNQQTVMSFMMDQWLKDPKTYEHAEKMLGEEVAAALNASATQLQTNFKNGIIYAKDAGKELVEGLSKQIKYMVGFFLELLKDPTFLWYLLTDDNLWLSTTKFLNFNFIGVKVLAPLQSKLGNDFFKFVVNSPLTWARVTITILAIIANTLSKIDPKLAKLVLKLLVDGFGNSSALVAAPLDGAGAGWWLFGMDHNTITNDTALTAGEPYRWNYSEIDYNHPFQAPYENIQ